MNLIEKEQTIVGVGFVLSIWEFAVHALNTQLDFVHEIGMLRNYFCRLYRMRLLSKLSTLWMPNDDKWQEFFFVNHQSITKKKKIKQYKNVVTWNKHDNHIFFITFLHSPIQAIVRLTHWLHKLPTSNPRNSVAIITALSTLIETLI